MKILLAIALLTVSLGYAMPSENEILFNNEKKTEKTDKEKEKSKEDEKTARNKNIHSIKKWKITIVYKNGNTISKTIAVSKNSERSGLESAFAEADKYLKNKKRIKEFSVSPIGNNPYVLLAGE